MSDEVLVATGKVATITAETQIALNVGTSKGVRVDDKVTLFRDVEVRDPDTGEILGSLEYPRLKLKVIMVHDAYCVAAVTDRVPATADSGRLAARIRPVKKVSSSPLADGQTTVFVVIGEAAAVTRVAATQDDDSEEV